MVGMEKDILLLISRIRCFTENQASKVFQTKKRLGRKTVKKTLRKMCKDYTLSKYPCNINYAGYKDNSYVYYLSGSQMYKGRDLVKVLIGSEIVVKIEAMGGKINRFYRNVSVGKNKYDIFIEYSDPYYGIKQILVDVSTGENVDISKYKNISADIYKSTIPFFETPKILVVTSQKINNNEYRNLDINFVEPNLAKLSNYI
jgi:hypothetical protein